MRYLFLLLPISFSLPAIADYASAARQVDQQRQVERSQQQVINADKINRRLMSSISSVAAKHRGLSSTPSIGEVSEHGVYVRVEFSTRDGWECRANNATLSCANVSLNREFHMENWQKGGPYVTLIMGQGVGFL